MSDIVRVLRILEYVGERQWVEDTLKNSSVPADGVRVVSERKGNIIKSCLVDKFPEIIEKDI